MNTTTEALKSRDRSKAPSDHSGRIVQKVLGALIYILVMALAIVFALPILLLPISTPVSAWIWIPLGILYIVLVVLPFRITPAWKGITAGLGGMLIVSILAVMISQALAFTPPITDANGDVIPGSIATLE